MTIKKTIKKKTTWHFVIGASLVIITGYWALGFRDFVFSQSEKKHDTNTMKQGLETSDSADEVQSLIDGLNAKQLSSPELRIEAILKLGSIGDKRAIPVLIKNINFERTFEPRQKQYPGTVDQWDDPKPISTRFPAVTALFQIGKDSIPALLRVIENNPVDSIESQNALFTVNFIFRDDLSKAVKLIERDLNKTTDPKAHSRLLNALEKTRKEYLRHLN